MKKYLLLLLALLSHSALAGDLSLIGGGNVTYDNRAHYSNVYGAQLNGSLVGPITLGVLATNNGFAMGSLGVDISKDKEVGSFGVLVGKNSATNAAGVYVSREILGPITAGSVLLSDLHNTTYALTIGIHW